MKLNIFKLYLKVFGCRIKKRKSFDFLFSYSQYLKNVTDGDDVMVEEEFYEFQYDNLVDKYSSYVSINK